MTWGLPGLVAMWRGAGVLAGVANDDLIIPSAVQGNDPGAHRLSSGKRMMFRQLASILRRPDWQGREIHAVDPQYGGYISFAAAGCHMAPPNGPAAPSTEPSTLIYPN